MSTLADITLNGGRVGLGGDGGSLLSLIRELCGRPVSSGSEELPFLKRPEDLTQNEWHLVFHDQIGDSEVAVPWRLKEEARQITMDLPILRWRIIREFHETDGRKTDWMMLEHKITTPSESFSLCRIWQGPGSQVGSDVPVMANQPGSVYGFPSADPSESETFASGNYLALEDLVD
ncbi:hypothetical protein MLD38_034425 [Melastoma candidum]|uniref:Uncharacterized protein n=1 Tax=Melastoma candidum TaxID=119954 RepID=A0ACB9MDK8_9MYRT|nr:hypothetical protein MLD38_034425 [Melastoma candidum]